MATLQQYECLFELVHDSVMTRTMDGVINFWNHSAEKLYGWGKEEAVGKVSHDLLQTQFPKALEEIESELVRNRVWEGRLVHTTRDGRRVGVKSRWALDLDGQPGALVEINARSTDPEARTNETTTVRKQAQYVVEQKVTTLQQPEYLFELINDSVMTRTMDGIINFWNQSAEKLYGWGKEEAIGKVSHDLLQTQFPKPLEEIESELVRNGQWEGKLVHTTRDGSRIVVESRWTLELKGQSGAIVEINTTSIDWEMPRTVHTDTYSAIDERQETVPPVKLVKKKEFLTTATRLADIILVGGGTVCLLVFSYFLYYYAWTGQRQFSSQLGLLLYYVCPAVLAVLFLASLRLRASSRINLALLVCSAGASIYTLEILLTLWAELPSVGEAENRRIIAKAAKAAGVDFDTRSEQEVIYDLRKKGVDAFPSVFAQGLLTQQNDGTMKSVISIDGIEVLPIAGIADKLIVLCNESGQFLTYTSDGHGFNNPKGLWNTGRVDIVALGDSFVHGFCVSPNKNFVALIRQHYPTTLNLGIGGNGPLTMLATIKEYGQFVKPKVVLWFYFEGNDLADLANERKSPLLSRYLGGEFSQNLFTRQPEIDRAIFEYIESINAKSQLAIKLEEVSALLRDPSQWQNETEAILKLADLRERLGVIYGSKSSRDNNVAGSISERDRFLTDLLQKILLDAKQSVSGWGGKLYFVYLPAWNRYVPGGEPNPDRDSVLDAANKAGLPIIDIHRVFVAKKDPLALFPFRVANHYNEEGHRLVAEEVLRSLSIGSK